MKQYRAAIVGCGRIGIEENIFAKNLHPWTHASGYMVHPRTQLVALVDKDPQRLKIANKYYPFVPTFLNLEGAIEHAKPDIVSVATPTHTHFEVVKTVARFDCVKAIVCEKPIAVELLEAKEMINICKKRKIIFLINHSRRFDPTFREASEKIKQFGPIIQGNAYYTRGICNSGTHLIDLLNWYLGDLKEVVGFVNKNTEGWVDLEDDLNIDGILFFKSGARVTIQSLDANNFSIFEINLYGKNGLVRISDHGFKIEYFNVRDSSEFFGKKVIGHNPKIFKTEKSMILSMVDNVINCLDGKEVPLASGNDALLALKLIKALELSSKRNCTIVEPSR